MVLISEAKDLIVLTEAARGVCRVCWGHVTFALTFDLNLTLAIKGETLIVRGIFSYI